MTHTTSHDAEAVPLPEPVAASIACEDCQGSGVVGDAIPQGEFQPPEYEACGSCDGSGRWKVQAVSIEQCRAYGDAREAKGREDERARLAAQAPDALRLLRAADTLFAHHCKDATAWSWLDDTRAVLARFGAAAPVLTASTEPAPDARGVEFAGWQERHRVHQGEWSRWMAVEPQDVEYRQRHARDNPHYNQIRQVFAALSATPEAASGEPAGAMTTAPPLGTEYWHANAHAAPGCFTWEGSSLDVLFLNDGHCYPTEAAALAALRAQAGSDAKGGQE